MHHIFDVEIATRYGVNAAVILQNLQYWIEHNKANGKCFYDGCYWTYNSVKAFSELFPYLSEYQIRTALQKLIDDGVVIRGEFNKTGMDRTLWYAITDKGEKILNKKEIEESTQAGMESDKENDQENPFGYYDSSSYPDTVESYAAQNLDRLSPGNMQDFAQYKRRLPDELIRHAIDEACANSARSWNYVRRILDRYIESGYKTIAQVLAAEDTNARRKRMNSPPQNENPLSRTKFY